MSLHKIYKEGALPRKKDPQSQERYAQRMASLDTQVKQAFFDIGNAWVKEERDREGEDHQIPIIDILGPFSAGLLRGIATICWDHADEGSSVEVVLESLAAPLRATLEELANDRPAGVLIRMQEADEARATGRMN